MPQDPGQAGKAQAADFVKFLAGHNVKTQTVNGDKVTRSEPFAAQWQAGNVDGLAADMVRSPSVTASSMQAAQMEQRDAFSGILTGIQNAVGALQNPQQSVGNISIPVYIGGTLLDEVVVNAQNRQNLRSGGR